MLLRSLNTVLEDELSRDGFSIATLNDEVNECMTNGFSTVNWDNYPGDSAGVTDETTTILSKSILDAAISSKIAESIHNVPVTVDSVSEELRDRVVVASEEGIEYDESLVRDEYAKEGQPEYIVSGIAVATSECDYTLDGTDIGGESLDSWVMGTADKIVEHLSNQNSCMHKLVGNIVSKPLAFSIDNKVFAYK